MNSEKKNVDLHVHTNFSDGTFSPREAVLHSRKVNLAAIAITDHDCVDGIAPAMDAAKSAGVEIIPGVELSAEVEDFEIHIVGLLIEAQQQWLKDELKKIRQARTVRMEKMVKKLNDLGVGIKLKDVLELSKQDGAIGRLHLARALYKKGFTHSVKEAFDSYIGRDKPCYEKRMIISPKQTIDMIKAVKGIPIYAHPGNMRHDEVIPELVKYGLMGIEAFHIDHSRTDTQHYKKIAEKYNLLLSGGSDCHGTGKGFPLMGMASVPYDVLEKIKQAKLKTYGEG